jgi:hypothetical protein
VSASTRRAPFSILRSLSGGIGRCRSFSLADIRWPRPTNRCPLSRAGNRRQLAELHGNQGAR